MKTLTRLFASILLLISVSGDAQITLEKAYPATPTDGLLQYVYLKHSGFKFVYLHNDTLSFYNLNQSLYKTVPIPGNWVPGNYVVQCISEGLFDTDSLHIDYMVNGGINDSIVIYKDNGMVVFRKDSAAIDIPDIGMQGAPFFPFVTTDSGTYMILAQLNGYGGVIGFNLYKLPGSFPCVPTCLGNSLAGISPVINSGGTMSIYPNPAISYTNIAYTLPQGTNQGEVVVYDLSGRKLKTYIVTSAFDHLRLTTSDIAAGTYFYQLIVNGVGVATKKIVVVK